MTLNLPKHPAYYLLGAPSDTLSGRAERGKQNGKRIWTGVYNVLDWLQPQHCEIALAEDNAGRHTESINLE